MRTQAENILREGAVIPALPLALDRDRRWDEAGQRRLIRYYLEAGAGGVAVAVHTTQFGIRRPEVGLFGPILELAAEEISAFEAETGRTVVKIAGACGPTGQAVAEAELARASGYDAVLLSPGGLEDREEAYLLDRTKAVAEIAPVVGFYLQTAVGGRAFSYDYWERLCEISGVCAIKTAPFDRYQTLTAVRAVALSSRWKEISLYTGNDDNLLFDLLTEFSFQKDGETRRVRFAGGLLGHWAVWTHKAVEYYGKVREARASGAIPADLLTLAAQITDANGAFFDAAGNFAGCIVGIHEVLRRQGLMEGAWTLDPEEALGDGQKREIDRVYTSYPHLNDDDFVREFLRRQDAGV